MFTNFNFNTNFLFSTSLLFLLATASAKESFVSTDTVQPPPNGICANFTRQFLEEFIHSSSGQNVSSSKQPLFGWISARGQFPVGLRNESQLVVQCLAVALSQRDFLIERTCFKALMPSIKQYPPLDPSFSNSSANEDTHNQHTPPGANQTVVDDGDIGQGRLGHMLIIQEETPILAAGGSKFRAFGPELISFMRPHRHRRRQHKPVGLPCIFPIDESFSSKLEWNATICGLKKIGQNTSNSRLPLVVCHQIQLNQSKKGMQPLFNSNAFQPLRDSLQVQSPLFIFDANNPDNIAYLRGLGTMGKSVIHLFDQNDCQQLANSSENRVRCAGDEKSTSVRDMQLVEKADGGSLELLPSLLEQSAPNAEVGPMGPYYADALRPFAQKDAEAAALMIPLVVLSVLIATGMLITIISYIVQQQRQADYNAIS